MQSIPLVVVPTMFPTASVEELSEAGFKVIIFANQALRAAVAAMRAQLHVLRKEGRAEVIDGAIASLQDIYDLVGVNELQAREEAFIPAAQNQEPVTAVILAAGYEEQLLPLTEDRPKTMLEIKGKSILERQVNLLQAAGVSQIAVVRGYRAEAVNLPHVRFFENPHFQSTGIAASLFTAEPVLKGRVLILYGDILFDRTILDRLLASQADISLAVDRAWYDLYRTEGRSPEGADLVVTNHLPAPSHRFIPSEEPGDVSKIGQQLDKRTVTGEFIGLSCFSAQGIQWLKETYKTSASQETSLNDLIQKIIDRGHPVKAVEVYKGWLEVDTFDDYRRAWAKL